jgi:uncharacterized membrane protein
VTRYELLLFLHVATAVVWVGGATAVQLLAFRADRADDPLEMHRVTSGAEWLATRVFVPSSALVLVFGIALVLDGPWGFDQLWIVVGLAGYAFSFLVGTLFLSPETGRIARGIEAHGPTHETVVARIRRILVVSRFELAVLFVVLLDMSLKPEAGDGWFWVLAAAILLAGAAFSAAAYRRPGARSASDLA